MNRAQRRAYMKQPSEYNRIANNAYRIIEHERKESIRSSGNYAWTMILAAVGLKMKENGKSDDKIGNFLISVQELIDRLIDEGEDAETIVKMLEEKTGIVLKIK